VPEADHGRNGQCLTAQSVDPELIGLRHCDIREPDSLLDVPDHSRQRNQQQSGLQLQHRIVGGLVDGLRQQRDCGWLVTLLMRDQPQQVRGFRVSGVDREHLAIDRGRLTQAPGQVMAYCGLQCFGYVRHAE